ncbi:di-trans,poly-cis-decaprenylcistransferase [Candidatus Uhrbacteria bacterium CG10_big_fil_rev_8_21_14_0_10_50_16]|uniref:Isoprenyl transferase n=1 Tax=Candidatus Uhrbacteria bacterium CG10_big_fil_rev_8_21_14_0_10_50_16 TaxID=1975039 RepID=A0A2H0RNL2_9BACT|nr:MAG: di-trans,poly-cis-decaprenylcistransferase [Candidatus Uhrbacteria bacterium CG10_big_fil_rev_8_21_14_0_10_50_16]
MKHFAIIIDGNRRWARERGLPTLEGHRRGYENVKIIGQAALERGIEHLTIYAFSTENWKRSEEEVGYLMDLLLRVLTADRQFFINQGARVRVIGRREGLNNKIIQAIQETEAATAGGTRGQINLCINYGGRAEIVDAVNQLFAAGQEVTEETINTTIWMQGVPEPDIIVRTSGEQRLSGFLTWSGVYSELKFIEKNWPDFTEADLDDCLADYDHRQRRFGQ